jgi:hypothetical protein
MEQVLLGVWVRPIRIRTMQTMNGTIFSVRCRACGMTFSYMADLAYAFEASDRHIARHKREIAEREAELPLELQH